MTSPANPLALGKSLQQAGKLPEAEAVFRECTATNPDNVEAWWMLGVVCRSQGRFPEAVEAYRRALRVSPNSAELHVCLGNVFFDQGQHADATDAYRQALRLRPETVEAHNGLGAVFRAQEKFEEAAACFREAIRVSPKFVMGYTNLGESLVNLGKTEEGLKQYDLALQLDPNDVNTLTNKGVSLVAAGKLEEGVALQRKALAIRPGFDRALVNLASALLVQGNASEAEVVCREAIRVAPKESKAHFNLGTALLERDAFLEAEASFRQALRLNPNFLQARRSLAILKRSLATHHEAIACFEEALRIKPDDPHCRMARAMLLLRTGQFKEGWREYEWRWKVHPHDVRFTGPTWDGSRFDSRTLLLYAEQGLGDTIQFVRYAPIVKRLGGRVILQCAAELHPLLANFPGIDELAPRDKPPPPADLHAMLLSLPGILGTDSSNIPADVPYLAASLELVEKWKQELAHVPGYKVGIAWQGNKSHPADRHRSAPLKQFAPLARVPGVSLISLQKGTGTEQLAEWKEAPIRDFTSRLDQTSGPFMDTAAVLRNLDLVITVDTATAHLAGALGVPVWVAVSADPDWRWQYGREDSPWYPTMRLFRQKRFGIWDDVFAQLATVLERRLQPVGLGRPVNAEVSAGELLDRITILQIKSERFADAEKQRRVLEELGLLMAVADRTLPASESLASLTAELRAVNERLWEIEDAIRERESESDFGERFVSLARSVYQNNDHRASLKRRINELVGSRLMEQKGYAACTS